MSLFRMRLQLPRQPGTLAGITDAIPGVQVVEVHVGQPRVGAVVADLVLEASNLSVMREVIDRASQRSPWVRVVPLHVPVDDHMYRLVGLPPAGGRSPHAGAESTGRAQQYPLRSVRSSPVMEEEQHG